MIGLCSKVKCIVTGFIGITISRVEYASGCVQYGVVPMSKDGYTYPKSTYIDSRQLEVIAEDVVVLGNKGQRNIPLGIGFAKN